MFYRLSNPNFSVFILFPEMNPRLYPYSIFFLLVLLLISTVIPISVCADDSNQYTNCSSHFSCGNISNVGYPFWGDNRAEYCGQPGFQLSCQDSIPKLIVSPITYRILNFSFSDQSLTVARDDYWKTLCPSQYINTSFDSTNFKHADGFQNMILLYECSNNENPVSQFTLSPEHKQCSSNGSTSQNNVYYGSESVASGIDLDGICKVVVIPIKDAYVSLVMSLQKDIVDAIDDGFGLQWMVDNNECNDCVSSGGQCGYTNTTQKFTCFCNNGRQGTTCSGSSSKRDQIIIASALAGAAVVIVSYIVIICYRNRSFQLGENISIARGTSVETFMETYGTLAPRKYTYSEVKRMSKSFTTKIGQGGYGTVYKATMPDSRLVAVKVLSETKGTGEEFINEVASITRTSHVNVVSLLGFCYEKSKRALIYEFMPNGSLDKLIYKGHSSNAICNFEWLRLYQIAIGIARGLEYLHQGCNTRILHLDIKPQNILLDEDFCPKISDFGLAKICRKRESIVSILGMRGTIGYIAPEVFCRSYGGVSHKSDVYSYGMLVLELIGGRKNFDSGGLHTSDMYFPDWIYKELEQSNVVTTNMPIMEEEKEVVRKMTLVGLWCIQTNPANRPSMSKVVEMLEGPNESLSFPPRPSLYSPPRPSIHLSDVPSSTMLNSNSTPIQTE